MKVRGVNMVAREELNNSRPGLTFGVIYPPIPGPSGSGQHAHRVTPGTELLGLTQ